VDTTLGTKLFDGLMKHCYENSPVATARALRMMIIGSPVIMPK
jgi:hypothetical protein